MNTHEITNIVVVGVGGQGSVLAGQIIARAAMLAGLSVATSEVHGMAQRGGSVFSTVRYGKAVLSPAVSEGTADVLLAFEKLEALRYLNYLTTNGLALVNDQRIVPSIESLKLAPYPDDRTLEETLRRRTRSAFLVPALKIAQQIGTPALTNTVMLGALSLFLDLPQDAWHSAVTELVPPKTVELNLLAFDEGLQWAKHHAHIVT
ncbi:MAG: indolepyruvate oxidoreductase subunit beta [Candidatus Bipolaricaulota bacterium]|nr:indolepyruvate oxidoreductase subunit beta [Candidatus Bipolaricaulota bacterium]MDW8030938.1 indolepyruvate oxidoreductase subunit beta [Candidatus Bipolaricaulota bacterium]